MSRYEDYTKDNLYYELDEYINDYGLSMILEILTDVVKDKE